MENVAQQKLIDVAHYVEDQLDNEIAKLDNLDINDFEKLRENRLKQLKKNHQQEQTWRLLGHGECSELSDEKEFFEVSKKSEHIVCLFYRDDSEQCTVIDHHMKILATKHIEAKFCKLNCARCPFLIGRLNIKTVPTIAIILNNKIKDYIVGLSDIRSGDNISTQALEYKLSVSGVITCKDENLERFNRSGIHGRLKMKTIRGKNTDELDFEQ